MGRVYKAEFRHEAVRLALSSGLSRERIAQDLGIGCSTLKKWIRDAQQHDTVVADATDHAALLLENERLRRENLLLREERELLKKANTVLREPKVVRFAFIARYHGPLSRERVCRLFGVSERGFRAWRRRPVCARRRQDDILMVHIRAIHAQSRQSYGRPRMTEKLRAAGLSVGHRRVGRLMREYDIRVVRTRRFKVTTNSSHKHNIEPNLLGQDFSAPALNRKWTADITYIWTREGWVYLAVVLDLFSRRVIGWNLGSRMTADLATTALQRAIALRQPPPGCIHHADRGSQYCSEDYRKLLSTHGFIVSMSRKGNCWDNAVTESFFKTVKAELLWRHAWMTRQEVEQAITSYINDFYNPQRLHSAIQWKSPLDYERNAA
ncbi:IS3 family transposase [Gluconobacter cerinus]|uniref:IS3 family transposase n=1 Tax=Gluconobacter cerinus TaxID=38307 RepID=UPI001B8D22E2|nr:IS3 family transposase [Gluconobacter cerinus]MBS1042072.1 IS3 family transposase [Gluconobacter cerinus]MBS1048634.1 IS3 family transposase [Gluconobacter cerinus]